MNIGILTHPQGINYGGILQCFALSEYIKKLGHNPIVFQRAPDGSFFLWEWTRSLLRWLHFPRYYTPKPKFNSMEKIDVFIKNELNRTAPIHTQHEMLKVCKKYNLEAVVVGSDQVWRQSFSKKYGFNYFLDFVPKGVKKISYAASFGLSSWDYSSKQTERIKDLLLSFQGISVREEDGIVLCKNYLNIEPELMVDPTFLLTTEDYDTIASKRLIDVKFIFVYWIGEKKLIESKIKEYTDKGYSIVYVGLREQRIMPSVGDWLSYIKYADIVLTDSFHGCVYSLLYLRPLIVFENKSGGFGRIESLLNLLEIDKSHKEGIIRVDKTKLDLFLAEVRNKARVFINKALI